MGDRILVSGGAGFIGCHTALALLAGGYDVRALDWLRPPIHQPDMPPPWLSDEVELLVGDVCDRDTVARALRGVDAVVHLAAYQDYLPDFSTFFHVNTVGTALLYEVIVEDRLPVRKVVIASSQAVYGEGRNSCDRHGVMHPDLRSSEQLRAGDWDVRCGSCGERTSWQLTDESTVNPQNQYAISKYTQEMVALNLGRRYGIPTTCMRYSITQGRWQSPWNAYSGICRIFTLRGRARKSPVAFEDGLQRRDYVYVGDVARANLLALEEPRTDFGVYNVGGSQALTTLDYANIVREVVGLVAPAEVPGYYRFGDTRHIVSDISKFRGLGWEPTLQVEEIVREYVDWVSSAGFVDHASDASLASMFRLGTLRRVSMEGVSG